MIDTEHFTYDRSWVEIETMLDKAERKQNWHFTKATTTHKSKRIEHMRNYKALEGVVKALRWVLGDKDVQHPLE
tara:strand:+ start:311 stop:532 length:222 start_codon:yes stop_codon:yes gene_type:complete